MDVCVCLNSICVILSVGTGLNDGLIPRSRGLANYVYDQETEKSGQGLTMGCRAIDDDDNNNNKSA
jgi:hypothetical protein